ncbi:hypothetical protein H0W26_04040 [Candidatus Dependentiae bacterium]|nr:hypothetical protein [Candidatus Dependentiae bacterium]
MKHGIGRQVFVLLMISFAGFSLTCMEQNLSKNWYELSHKELGTVVSSSNKLFYELEGSLCAVAFSTDTILMVLGSMKGSVSLWSIKEGLLPQKFLGHTARIMAILCNVDCSRFLTGSYDGTTRLWNATTGHQLLEVPSPTDEKCLALSSKGNFVLVGYDDGIACLWDSKTKEKRYTFEGRGKSEISFTAFNEDDSVALVERKDNNYITSVWLYDTTTGNLIQALGTNDTPGKSVSYSFDKKTLAVLFKNSTARVFDSKTGKERFFLGEQQLDSAVFNPTGTNILTTSLDSIYRWPLPNPPSTVSLWNIETGEKLQQITKDDCRSTTTETDRYFIAAASSPDDTILFIGLSSGKSFLFHRGTNDKLIELEKRINWLFPTVFSPNGKTILGISSFSDNTKISLWDTATGDELLELQGSITNYAVMKAGFSPCGNVIFARDILGKIRLWVSSDSVQESFKTKVEESSKTNRTLGLRQAINLDDDSQKECSIQ